MAGLAPITIDSPTKGSLFPPDIAPPTFLWRDVGSGANIWVLDISFADRSRPIRITSHGEKPRIGEIDERCAKAGAVAPQLTADEAAAHSWKPDAETWEAI